MYWVVAQIVLFLVFFTITPGEAFADSSLISVLAIFCGVLGVIVGYKSVYDLRHSLSISPEPVKGGSLVTYGIYGYIRHPMYVAAMLGFLSLALWSGSWNRFFVWVAIVLFFVAKTRYEEHLLRKRYPEYDKYSKSTGAFLPKL